MKYELRMKPKGYNTKAWLHLYAEAETEKQWALDTLKNQEWLNNASISSIEYLGACLHMKAHQIAKEKYDYLFMRAHGQTFIGALDPSARKKWESISGKRVLPKHCWKYDHTVHITSAVYKNKQWFNNDKIVKPVSVR